MFPDVHPSKGSVPNMGIGLGCPAIIFDQMSSDQWKSTTRAQIDERQPTFKKGRRVGLPRPPPTACSAALPSSVGALACPAQTATATGDRSWNLRPRQPPPHAASIAPVRHDTTHHAEHPAPRVHDRPRPSPRHRRAAAGRARRTCPTSRRRRACWSLLARCSSSRRRRRRPTRAT